MKPFRQFCHDSTPSRTEPLVLMRLDDALHIVTHPELYHDRAILRRLAWVVLMQERGGRVDQARLARMPVLGAA